MGTGGPRGGSRSRHSHVQPLGANFSSASGKSGLSRSCQAALPDYGFLETSIWPSSTSPSVFEVHCVLITTWSIIVLTSANIFDYGTKIGKTNGFLQFGIRTKRNAPNPEKRDISLAYSATNINSKEGTQVKTVTVIKNIGTDRNSGTLQIKPELSKSEVWTNTFKDNFHGYGVIPDVPDVEDLFEYVNKKHIVVENNKEHSKSGGDEMKQKNNVTPKQTEKPTFEESSEEFVEKIEGDAELLPKVNTSKLKTRESLVDFNYSTPQHSVHQYFDNYVQLNPSHNIGYSYPKPCIHEQPVGSEVVVTPSGKTYNIPKNNTNADINPYLAPSVTRRPQISQQTQSTVGQTKAPVFPINSLLPPLQQQQPGPVIQQSNTLVTQQPTSASPQQQQTNNQQQSQSLLPSTSQRPYVAPNLRSGLNAVSRGPASTAIASVGSPSNRVYRINSYNTIFRKPNASRSRGLKY
ncbi:uncharacterized protein LOC133334135 [Musca vetustissima]|uniref:uncharacterized protein LOC133334135 n=1 Tax=Musca vetustissima TaxID=27455 RepID=UPI002AB74849|nr:uncharacterized protein LOC133334135 [Musca vetustissima]